MLLHLSMQTHTALSTWQTLPGNNWMTTSTQKKSIKERWRKSCAHMCVRWNFHTLRRNYDTFDAKMICFIQLIKKNDSPVCSIYSSYISINFGGDWWWWLLYIVSYFSPGQKGILSPLFVSTCPLIGNISIIKISKIPPPLEKKPFKHEK